MFEAAVEEESRPVVDLGLEWDFAPAPWMKEAVCGGIEDPELFHPDHDRDLVRLATAKTICAGCPVKDHCLQYALDENIYHGIWGGLTPRERHALVRRTRLTEMRRRLG